MELEFSALLGLDDEGLGGVGSGKRPPHRQRLAPEQHAQLRGLALPKREDGGAALEQVRHVSAVVEHDPERLVVGRADAFHPELGHWVERIGSRLLYSGKEKEGAKHR